MKKENILVVVLVVMALGAVTAYNLMRSSEPEPATESVSAIVRESSAAVSDVSSGTGIDWKDFTPGMALAREKGKSIFLYFHAPWCTYCTKLKMTTFKDEKVMAYLRENFISIGVDTDQNRSLASQWNVTGLPTLWFLEPSGKKINNMPGYVTADQLLQILKYIHTKSYTTMAFQDFVKQN